MTDDEAIAVAVGHRKPYPPADARDLAIFRAGIAAERARLLPVLTELVACYDIVPETQAGWDALVPREERAWAAARAAVGEQ